MNSINRVANGVQDSANELVKGVMGGINSAHRETVDTVQDAILGKWSMISKHAPTRSHSVGTVLGLHLLMINAFTFQVHWPTSSAMSPQRRSQRVTLPLTN